MAMNASIYPWQEGAWHTLAQMRERLPHAILFHGPAGSGKTLFAERFAQALLCQAPDADGHACGRCSSCGWFVQYGHPDYRRVRPEALEEGQGESEEGGETGAGTARDSGTAGGKAGGKAARAPSREIKVEQIRALSDFMNISTHRQGSRIVLLHPAEALNTIAANALLKTLEEPPPATVFLLVANGIDRLLPTILSRCRKFSLPQPGTEQALGWLREQGVKDAETWLAREGGAPLTALAQAQGGVGEAFAALLSHLARPEAGDALKTAELLQKNPPVELVGWQQRWLYDMFSSKMSGRIRYYPGHKKELEALAARVDTAALLRVLKTAGQRRAIAEHPLSARLFIEDMLLDYATLFA
jgi:DNA polymerase-3 subunit delta'